MADEEITKGVRLTPEQAKMLDELNISFSDLAREAIDTKQKENKINNKKQVINKLIANGVYAIIGLSLLTALSTQSNIFTIAIIGGLGAFFTVIGSYNLYITIKGANFERTKK